MKDRQAHLKLITPCFCAGADQQRAEIRVPSIRGQLRWWFRVLGGNQEQERKVFGGISSQCEDSQPVASNVRLRVAEVKNIIGNENDLPKTNNDPLGYLLYYARIAGNRESIYRFREGGWLAPDSSFILQASFRQPLEKPEADLFDHSWESFLLLGSLGLRQTRGFGAMATDSPHTWDNFRQSCRTACPSIKKWYVVNNDNKPLFYNTSKEAMIQLEAALGWIRQNGFSAGRYGDNPTPLGKSARGRQASALHLRPVLLKEGYLPLLYYTPTVLSPENRRGDLENFLNNMTFKTPYQQRSNQQRGNARTSLSLRTLE